MCWFKSDLYQMSSKVIQIYFLTFDFIFNSQSLRQPSTFIDPFRPRFGFQNLLEIKWLSYLKHFLAPFSQTQPVSSKYRFDLSRNWLDQPCLYIKIFIFIIIIYLIANLPPFIVINFRNGEINRILPK